MNSRVNRSHWRTLMERLVLDSEATLPGIAVLAAHPDDETIGASLPLARSTHPTVIYLTDGAPRNRALWPPEYRGTREQYAKLRSDEARNALTHAGVSADRIHWLAAIDQESVYGISKWLRLLAGILEEQRPELIITHSYEGGHPDHDVCALIANLAVQQLLQVAKPQVIEMTSYHVRDGKCVTGEFLNRDLAKTLELRLTGADRERKQNMMGAHASQRLVLEQFGTDRERYRLAPAYDFSDPPHGGRLWYERMGWDMTGERWRSLAAQAIADVRQAACL